MQLFHKLTFLLTGIAALIVTTQSWAQTTPESNHPKLTYVTSENVNAADITRTLTPGRGIHVIEEPSCEARETTSPRGIQIAVSEPLAFSFDSNSAKLSSQAVHILDVIGQSLTSDQLKRYRFQIEGHTDNKGSDDLNCRLSQNRARIVASYLGKNFGIPASRLVAKGYGKTQPVASNNTEEGRRKNRRVQVVNLGLSQ